METTDEKFNDLIGILKKEIQINDEKLKTEKMSNVYKEIYYKRYGLLYALEIAERLNIKK